MVLVRVHEWLCYQIYKYIYLNNTKLNCMTSFISISIDPHHRLHIEFIDLKWKLLLFYYQFRLKNSIETTTAKSYYKTIRIIKRFAHTNWCLFVSNVYRNSHKLIAYIYYDYYGLSNTQMPKKQWQNAIKITWNNFKYSNW